MTPLYDRTNVHCIGSGYINKIENWKSKMINVSSQFDGGNGIYIQCEKTGEIKIEISHDNHSDFYQWFYFRVANTSQTLCKIRITNAGGAAYTKGWEDYRAVISYDRKKWFRAKTVYQGEELLITHQAMYDSFYCAYFAPFSMEQHADLIAKAQLSNLTKSTVIGKTLDGQDMDLLQIGSHDPGKKVGWIIARQHPGETMAEWWMEGFINRILDEDDPVSNAVLKKMVFYAVPNMNPDGSRRGHLRTNAVGVNLNREWQSPSEKRSPEVYCVRDEMHETGVDFCLDVHGDEGLPYNFIAGSEGIESWNEERNDLLNAYKNLLASLNSDFQTKYGYPVTYAGQANLGICTNYIGETFNCLSMTLEMPFKDAANNPDDNVGWSPERCQALGRSNIDAIDQIFPRLT